MTIEIRVPPLPESVADAEVAAWLKQPGEFVAAEESLLDLETDKVVLSVPAPASGVLKDILVEVNTRVVAGDLLAIFEPAEAREAVAAEAEQERSDSLSMASPSVRKAMNAQGLKAAEVQATGDKGRILPEDVARAVKRRKLKEKSATKPNTLKEVDAEPAFAGPLGERPTRRVPMSRMRQRIAERLLEAQSHAAILTTFNEVDLSDLVRLRKTYQERFQHAHGIKLGFMSFFVKAATEALKRFPEVNARIDGENILYQGFYDIGVAVSTERGLVVPILRNTHSMGHSEIEKTIADFSTRARDGRLDMEELQGGTFSISNGGVFGSMLSTPILNPPQSAILGMHKIEERAVVREGQVVVRPMMYLALSYDHRLIDGKTAVGFLVKIKELLEDPASLLLEL